jgi:hypothetical protein
MLGTWGRINLVLSMSVSETVRGLNGTGRMELAIEYRECRISGLRAILAEFSGNFKKQNAFRIGDMTTVRKIDL